MRSIFKDVLELLDGKEFSSVDETDDAVERHDILREHGEVLEEGVELGDGEVETAGFAGFEEAFVEVWRVVVEELVEVDDGVVVVEVVHGLLGDLDGVVDGFEEDFAAFATSSGLVALEGGDLDGELLVLFGELGDFLLVREVDIVARFVVFELLLEIFHLVG